MDSSQEALHTHKLWAAEQAGETLFVVLSLTGEK